MSYTDELPATRTERHDGWTTERQLAFLDDLGEHGVVIMAARQVGMSASSAYRLRAREANGAFGFGWRAAMAQAYDRMRQLALDRATNGVPSAAIYRGEITAFRTIYSDRLLLGLLEHLRPRAEAPADAAAGKRPPPEPGLAWGATLDAYETALETGKDVCTPQIDDGTGRPPVKRMTREEFIAAIRLRPKSADLPGGANYKGDAGTAAPAGAAG